MNTAILCRYSQSESRLVSGIISSQPHFHPAATIKTSSNVYLTPFNARWIVALRLHLLSISKKKNSNVQLQVSGGGVNLLKTVKHQGKHKNKESRNKMEK